MTLLALGANVIGQVTPAQRLEGTSVPVSSSVLATILSADDQLMLMVLWRGDRKEWYSAGPPHSESGGGQNGTYSLTLQRGDVVLHLQFDSSASRAIVQGKTISMPPGANVLLVDGVDGPGGSSSVRALGMDAGGANLDARKGIGSLADLLGRSPDVVRFLRCSDESERGFSTSPCHSLTKR